jgi:ABC-type transporter Mla subunit MlaD
MNPIDFITRWKLILEGLAILALIAGICYSAHRFIQHEQQIGYDRAQAEYLAKDNERLKAALAQTEFYKQRLDEATQHANDREKAILAAANAASGASVGLQHTLDSIRAGVPSAAVDALRQTTATLASVLGECQARYRELGQKADGHASDVQTLMEAWPK